MPLTLDEYLVWTDGFAVYPEIGTRSGAERAYLGLGLCGEVGELCDKLKKRLRDGVHDDAAIKAELGDILWYWARLCRIPRLEPSHVAGLQPPNATMAVGDEVAIHLAHAAGRVAEFISDDPLHPYIVTGLARVYSIWAHTCAWLGFDVDDVRQANISKLEARRARGTLQGSGDHR